ncbi:hypothetical protein HKD37_18G051762 [Glycine soja]
MVSESDSVRLRFRCDHPSFVVHAPSPRFVCEGVCWEIPKSHIGCLSLQNQSFRYISTHRSTFTMYSSI